jgi:hypothetical protein
LVRNPTTKEILRMKVLKSIQEVEAAGLSPPVRDVVHRVVQGFINALAKYGGTYVPEDDGYTILIEGGDEAEVAVEIGYPLADALFEGVYREEGCFVGCVLHNNQFGYSLVFVDSPRLDPAICARLVAECDAGASP